jgi:hypothetical protein
VKYASGKERNTIQLYKRVNVQVVDRRQLINRS